MYNIYARQEVPGAAVKEGLLGDEDPERKPKSGTGAPQRWVDLRLAAQHRDGWKELVEAPCSA